MKPPSDDDSIAAPEKTPQPITSPTNEADYSRFLKRVPNPIDDNPIKIGPYKVKLHDREKTSDLYIDADWVDIRISIRNKFSVRNRRQFLLSMNAALLSNLDFFHYSHIHHREHVADRFREDLFSKRLSTKQAIYVKDEQSKLQYWIRGFRTRAGMTQIQFAKLLGISNHHLSKVEKGHKPISRVLANKILEVKRQLEDEYPGLI